MKACLACGGGRERFYAYSGFIRQVVWAEAQESRRERDINAGFRALLCHSYAPNSPLAGSAQCPMVRTVVQSVSPITLSAES